jgi:hypothetical protein
MAGSLKWMPDVTSGYLVTVHTTYSEYRQYNGLTLPTQIIAYKDGEEWIRTKIDELTLCDAIAPELFAKPAKKADQ